MSNTRYPEGSIAERYIASESVTYCRSYLQLEQHGEADPPLWNISCVSPKVKPDIMDNSGDIRLTDEQLADAHWQILIDTEEVNDYFEEHKIKYTERYGEEVDYRHRRRSFLRWFLKYVRTSVYEILLFYNI